ncbi:MAG: hypothetical protein J5679_02700 [Alphaproteobacteria bacterium]|nr:hypothetical protein [Alphaproteobacteria bacterium]
MKLWALFLCLIGVFTPAFAEETQKIVDRKTCEQIRAEIAELSAIENPTSEEQDNLKQLNTQLRVSCAIKGNGRRTVARPGTQTTNDNVDSQNAETGAMDVLDEYIANKKANCDKLNAEMEKLKADTTKDYIVKEMQRYYNADCVTLTPPAAAVETITAAVVSSVPAKTDAEIEAEFNANIAAGLCGDGTKPNRFGCCTGETFKDLGNSQYACCPKTGDLCFPPLK